MSIRHSNWYKRVPAPLLEKQELWRGPPPTGSADPRWQEYRQRLEQQQIRVVNKLAQGWQVRGGQGDLTFWRDMAVNLLELFPAFEVLPETRGKKIQREVEPASAARQARRGKRSS